MSADDHGSASTYRNHACRCDKCREAQRDAVADYRQRHPEQLEKRRVYMRRLRESRGSIGETSGPRAASTAGDLPEPNQGVREP